MGSSKKQPFVQTVFSTALQIYTKVTVRNKRVCILSDIPTCSDPQLSLESIQKINYKTFKKKYFPIEAQRE